ncbi:hypothetical protein SRABI128_06469 [Microbacterium sp. Bi128]|nr:hypothetical protein SRABI128_06469 [Microbacterium sp. Bi128]
MLGDLAGQRSGGQPDPGAELEDVDGAEDFLEDARHSGGRVDAGRGQLEERGLAGAVGAQDHPAFALFDLPVDLVQERLRPTYNTDPGHFKNITHRSRH